LRHKKCDSTSESSTSWHIVCSMPHRRCTCVAFSRKPGISRYSARIWLSTSSIVLMTATLFETKHISLRSNSPTANPGHDDDVPSFRIGGRREPLYASQSNRFQVVRGKIGRNETSRRLT